MSWLFSRALVEASLGASFSDGTPSAQSSGTPTPQAYCAPDKTTDFSRPSRFGMTFGHLTDDLGAAVLTWCLADSLVRTSASQEKAMDSTANAPACGRKWRGSLARYDHDSRSWKTAQHSLLGDSDEFSETWPRWGTARGGELFLLPTPALLTFGNESGLLPTLLVPNGGRSVKHVTEWRGRSAYHNGKKVQVSLHAALQMLPTLTVCGNYNRKGASKTSGDGLATALAKMPTLCARDYRSPGRSRMERTGGTHGECLPQVIGGPLNPTWCEWFMGFPLGWTELQPLATLKYHKPQPLRGAV
jgi:hypothetical protein